MVTNTPYIKTIKTQKDEKIFSIIALITAIIPILVWVFILLVKATETGNSVSGVGFIAGLFYMSWIGFALPIMTIIFGILGLLKSSLKKTAIVSLCLVVVHIILFISNTVH